MKKYFLKFGIFFRKLLKFEKIFSQKLHRKYIVIILWQQNNAESKPLRLLANSLWVFKLRNGTFYGWIYCNCMFYADVSIRLTFTLGLKKTLTLHTQHSINSCEVQKQENFFISFTK